MAGPGGFYPSTATLFAYTTPFRSVRCAQRKCFCQLIRLLCSDDNGRWDILLRYSCFVLFFCLLLLLFYEAWNVSLSSMSACELLLTATDIFQPGPPQSSTEKTWLRWDCRQLSSTQQQQQRVNFFSIQSSRNVDYKRMGRKPTNIVMRSGLGLLCDRIIYSAPYVRRDLVTAIFGLCRRWMTADSLR